MKLLDKQSALHNKLVLIYNCLSDRRDLPGHTEKCVEPRVDAAQCLPGRDGSHVRRRAELAAQLRCRQPAEGE